MMIGSWLRATFIVVLSVAATLGVLWGYTRVRGPHLSHLVNPYDHPRPFYVLDVMHQLQRYADKLYFAGTNENRELAAWYLWKLEAAASQLKDGQTEPYRTEAWDVQELAAMLDPTIGDLRQAIESGDPEAFTRSYGELVDACNACHRAAEHGFVRIIVPDGPPIYGNQDYSAPNSPQR